MALPPRLSTAERATRRQMVAVTGRIKLELPLLLRPKTSVDIIPATEEIMVTQVQAAIVRAAPA